MNQEIILASEVKPEVQQESSPVPFEKDAFIALFSLLEALSFELVSGDLWWLANHRAKSLAVQKYGISEDKYNEVMKKFDAARSSEGKKNPMHSMF